MTHATCTANKINKTEFLRIQKWERPCTEQTIRIELNSRRRASKCIGLQSACNVNVKWKNDMGIRYIYDTAYTQYGNPNAHCSACLMRTIVQVNIFINRRNALNVACCFESIDGYLCDLTYFNDILLNIFLYATQHICLPCLRVICILWCWANFFCKIHS